MKTITERTPFCLFLLFFPLLSNAQDLNWANGIGSDNFLGDAVKAIALDDAGNVYLTGRFSGTVDFDPGPDTFAIAAASGWDGFVAKYDASGNFVWAIGQASSEGGQSNSIAVDPIGNVYVVGHFLGACDFDPYSSAGYLTTNTSGQDMFLAKYDPDGNYLWAYNFGGTSYDFAYDIALDDDSNIYLTGFFRGTADFDPSPNEAILTTNGINDIVLAKYSKDGEYIWAKNMGGTAADEANSLALDKDGNIYLCGIFFLTADFDPGPEEANLNAVGAWDSFLAKYDPTGNFLWVKSIGSDQNDGGTAVAVDQDNNVVYTGYFNGTVDLDPSPEMDTVTSNGSTDLFIVKFDEAGNYTWGHAIGGGSTDLAKGLDLDPAGNIYLTGYYRWTVDFDPDLSGSSLLEANIGKEAFVASYTRTGQYRWAKSVEGEGDDDEGNAIVVGGPGRFVFGGEFFNTPDFDFGPDTYQQSSAGYGDMFVASYGPCFANADQQSTCSGTTFTFPDGSTTDSAMVHQSILTSIGGCDSLVTITLTIDTVNTLVQQNDNILTAFSEAGTFQWIDCNDQFAWLPGESASTFAATQNGSFAVIVTEGNCVDTSECFNVIGLSALHPQSADQVFIYPNPTSGKIAIAPGRQAGRIEGTLVDMSGMVLRRFTVVHKTALDISGLENGVYFLRLKSNGRTTSSKIVKTE